LLPDRICLLVEVQREKENYSKEEAFVNTKGVQETQKNKKYTTGFGTLPGGIPFSLIHLSSTEKKTKKWQ